MSWEGFLWLLHYGLCGFYLLTIGWYLYSRFGPDREVWEQIYDAGNPHENRVNESDHTNAAIALLAFHAVTYGFVVSENVPVLLIAMILGAAFCSKRLADVKPFFDNKDRQDRLAKRHRPAYAGMDFGPGSDDDDYFASGSANRTSKGAGFQPRWEGDDGTVETVGDEFLDDLINAAKQSYAEEERREREDAIRRETEAKVRREYEARQTKTPRGFEKRHPDDAKYWAKVDDPAASPEERAAMMRKIGERERKRNDNGN